jgi:ribonuclease HI
VVHFNESYTLKGAGAGVVLIPLECDILKYAIQLDFLATNNIAEYEGLVTGLWLAKDLSTRRLLIRGDSQLVAKQVQKEYDCNNDKMFEYLAEVHRIEKFFNGFEVRYVPRMDNRDADHLAWIASSRAPTQLDIIVEKLSKPLVEPAELMVINEPDQELAYDWINPIKIFLDNHLPSDDNDKVECITCKSKMYHLIDGILY